MSRIRVAVVFGGRSGEHAVSAKSASSMLANLDPRRYDAVGVRIGTDGGWQVGDDRPYPAGLPGTLAVLDELRRFDVVFPALHGRYGEDGTLQSMLARAGIPYVGNGVLASAIGMDKAFTKRLLTAGGLPVTADVLLGPGVDTLAAADRERLGLPVFVKPARAGSSLGVSRVDDWAALPAAVAAARCAGPRVLVEEAVLGREVDVAVLEHPDGRLEAGPPLEIRVPGGHEFFDYDAKYADAATVFDIPARLDPGTTAALQQLAVRAFRALDCAGLLRVDFFLRPDGSPVLNEVNTFPGFTSASQFPQIWRAAGVGYGQLLDIMIATALARHRSDAPDRTASALPASTP